MHENRTYFNLMEANALIPRLSYLFGEMFRIQKEMTLLERRAAELGIEIEMKDISNSSEVDHPLKRQLVMRIDNLTNDHAECLEEINEFGVIVEDIELGIVNFYSWFDGQEIFLAWQYGEDEITHWHAVTESADARQSLEELILDMDADVMLH